MAAAGWLRRAAAMPRLPSGISLIPPPPPAPLTEAQSLVVPGLGAAAAAAGPAMELMAVPKKKVSKYKKGLRNGPKALKPVPVIVRCRCCGRVKLPHFYCCSGERGNPSESSSTLRTMLHLNFGHRNTTEINSQIAFGIHLLFSFLAFNQCTLTIV